MALTEMQYESGIEYYNGATDICDSTDGSIAITVVKMGKIIQLFFGLPGTNLIPRRVWTTKCTLKSMFRPFKQINGAAIGSDGSQMGWARINTDGTLEIYHNLSEEYMQFSFSMVYIAN